jgi:hypothetical protein
MKLNESLNQVRRTGNEVTSFVSAMATIVGFFGMIFRKKKVAEQDNVQNPPNPSPGSGEGKQNGPSNLVN